MLPRRILVNASYAPSLLNFRGKLLEAMVALGHRVAASAPDMDAQTKQRLISIGVTPYQIAMSRNGNNVAGDLAYWHRLRNLIARERIDLVLGYTIKPCIWGSLAAKSLGIESVSLVTGLGLSFAQPERGQWARVLVQTVARRLWRAATAANRVVIFQNPDDRDDFIAAGSLSDPSKARLVNGSGVDLESFPQVAVPDDARFLMVARLLKAKGVREFGEAARQLREEGVQASFAIAGWFDDGPDGIEEEELDSWTRAGVEYLGHLDSVSSELAKCSVFVLPSYREGLPRSVLEAMATGRSIVTTDAPGCRETVIQERNGYLVPTRNSLALADAMRKLALNPAKRKSFGAASRKIVEEKFAVQAVNDTMLRHLEIGNERAQ